MMETNNKLPDKFWIENPNPGHATQEWKAAVGITGDTQDTKKPVYREGEWIVVIDTPNTRTFNSGESVGKCHELILSDINAISQYDDGKIKTFTLFNNKYLINFKRDDIRHATAQEIDIATGKVTQPQEKKVYTVGDWVVIVGDVNQLGETDSNNIPKFKNNTAYKVGNVAGKCVTTLSGKTCTLSFNRFRAATQSEIDAVQPKVKAMKDTQDKVTNYQPGDWIFIISAGCRCSGELGDGMILKVVSREPGGISEFSKSYTLSNGTAISGRSDATRLAEAHEIPKDSTQDTSNSPIGWVVGEEFKAGKSKKGGTWTLEKINDDIVIIRVKGSTTTVDYKVSEVNNYIAKGTWVKVPAPVSTEWKVGDVLTEKWLDTQDTYTRDPIINTGKSVCHGNRFVKEVSSDGWALISGTAGVWLTPKSTVSREAEEWQVGDKLTEEWLRKQYPYNDPYDSRHRGTLYVGYRERYVKEVRNGYALISGTSHAWLQPKSKCTPMKEEMVVIPNNSSPVPVTQDNCFIGMKVVRGKDWRWDNQDGGVGNVEVIIDEKTSPEWIRVQWPSGSRQNYRIGSKESYDLYIAPGETIKSTSNNSSLINNQKTTQHVTNNSSSRSTGFEQIIVSGDPEDASFQRGERKSGSTGQGGGEPLTIMRGYKGHSQVLTVSEEITY